MMPMRAPRITVGQVYLNVALNEYLVVTSARRGQINYAGVGFVGHSEDQSFIERFKPVDPNDLTDEELIALAEFCPEGTFLTTGFIEEEANVA